MMLPEWIQKHNSLYLMENHPVVSTHFIINVIYANTMLELEDPKSHCASFSGENDEMMMMMMKYKQNQVKVRL